MLAPLFMLFFSAFSFAEGVKFYKWLDMELALADKDRLFINYRDDMHEGKFPGFKLFSNREMKGDPAYEFNSKGTFEKGALRCALDNYDCQIGPIYKRPWSGIEDRWFGIIIPIKKRLDEKNFEIEHKGKLYFLNVSTLSQYEPVQVKFKNTDHLKMKSYWIQKSHSYLIQKIKEKIPTYDEEKKKAVQCLRSEDIKCVEKYDLITTINELKESAFSSYELYGAPTNDLVNFDFSVKNMNMRSSVANCIEYGKMLTNFNTSPIENGFEIDAELYDSGIIKLGNSHVGIDCSISFKVDKVGKIKSINVAFSSRER